MEKKSTIWNLIFENGCLKVWENMQDSESILVSEWTPIQKKGYAWITHLLSKEQAN